MAHIQIAKATNYTWDCPTCGSIETVSGSPDVITCKKCEHNQLAYTVALTEVKE